MDVVRTGADAWKRHEELTQDNAAPGHRFCSACLPLASNSQFVRSWCERSQDHFDNWKKQGAALSMHNLPVFFVEKLKADNKRLRQSRSDFGWHHRPDKQCLQKWSCQRCLHRKQKINTKGCKDKADNAAQRLEGTEDTLLIDGKTQRGKL
jgi:hypothetical protein